MARSDLTNEGIEQVGLNNPGSAAEYLRLRGEELEAEKQAEREKDDEERFVEQFVAADGNRADALAARKKLMNERATEAARLADEDALVQTKRNHHIIKSPKGPQPDGQSPQRVHSFRGRASRWMKRPSTE
jgi:hypothetical protein